MNEHDEQMRQEVAAKREASARLAEADFAGDEAKQIGEAWAVMTELQRRHGGNGWFSSDADGHPTYEVAEPRARHWFHVKLWPGEWELIERSERRAAEGSGPVTDALRQLDERDEADAGAVKKLSECEPGDDVLLRFRVGAVYSQAGDEYAEVGLSPERAGFHFGADLEVEIVGREGDS